ncbi:ankyrin repeat-containing domain protein [Tribonema minus]|uniref:Ankyrin repeat-containing domain protein n=1 Tax=Tribonema minus TaxID=303371 RepID=A0A836C9J9_9STRA|nr:ankyrin repeat-containing domain protein [Tribonema minus]
MLAEGEIGVSIFEAARRGDLAMVERWLQAGGDVNVRDDHDWSPLHIACEAGYYEIAELLLDYSAQVNVRGGLSKWTPLHLAAYRNRWKVVELLLDSGATCDVRGYFLRTPLHCAAFNGAVKTVKILLDNGADPLARDRDGRCPADTVEDALILDEQRDEVLDLLRSAAPRRHIGAASAAAAADTLREAVAPPLNEAAPSLIPPVPPLRRPPRVPAAAAAASTPGRSGGGGSAQHALRSPLHGHHRAGGLPSPGAPPPGPASPKFCRDCANPILSTYKFCPECGTQQLPLARSAPKG